MERNESKFEIFLEDLQTKEDLLNLLDEIRNASEQIFKTGDLPDEKTLSKEFIAKLLEAEKRDVFPASSSNRAKFFEDLTIFVREQKTVKIVLAFDPSKQFLQKVREFLGQTTKQKIFLDPTVREEIIGGFILDEAGVYSDYSLLGELSTAAADKDFLKEILLKEK